MTKRQRLPIPRLTRRMMLKGLGATALALPLLPEVHTVAQTGSYPKRVVFMVFPDGVQPPNWFPQTVRSPTDYDISATSSLQPIVRHRADINLVSGLQYRSTFRSTADLHGVVMPHILTGGPDSPSLSVNGITTPGGISMDRLLAKHLGTSTAFGSYYFGVWAGYNSEVQRQVSFDSKGNGREGQSSPVRVLSDLFGGKWVGDTWKPADIGNVTATPFSECTPLKSGEIGTGSGATTTATPTTDPRPWRKSVLDALKNDYARLRCELSQEGRAKLDAHLEGLRSVEQQAQTGLRAASGLPVLDGCYLALNQRDPNYASYAEWVPNASRMQIDLLTGALATDATRVAVLQYGASNSPFYFPFLDIPAAVKQTMHHDIAHMQDGSADAREAIRRVATFMVEQLAYMIDNFKAIPEGSGTMLDNTLIVFTSDMFYGNSHDRANLPVITAGRLGGTVKTGNFIDYSKVPGKRPFADILITVANAMGVPVTRFGETTVNDIYFNQGQMPGSTGPLAELLV